MPARNHINVFTPDVIVALPGNVGTRNELDMTAAYRDQAALGPQERRVVLVGPSAEFTPEHRAQFVHVSSAQAAGAHLVRILAAHGFRIPSEVIGEHAG